MWFGCSDKSGAANSSFLEWRDPSHDGFYDSGVVCVGIVNPQDLVDAFVAIHLGIAQAPGHIVDAGPH
jgi:hypothetical protein